MKRDNSGSTLITVIVAIAFVTILTSIILGTTVTNMAIKGIDRKVKDDFYYAEKGLNDVYTGIGQETAKIAGNKYEAEFSEIGKSFDTADEAGKAFRKDFLQAVYDKYAGTGIDADKRKEMLDAYVADTALPLRISSVKVTSGGTVKIRKKNGDLVDSITPADDAYDYVSVVIQKVAVSAADTNSYQSTIFSDIVIDCPTVDFLGTNAEITDYAIIGCKGIYFTSPAGGNNYIDVTGNLYGGVHSTANSEDTDIGSSSSLYGGININRSNVKLKSNYIVSKGDINIAGNGAQLSVGNSDTTLGIPSMWFDTMRTIGSTAAPKVDLNANLFALNDLELNANGSDVKLKGDYYGYNDKSIRTASEEAGGYSVNPEKYSLSYSSDREDADSSAIIINGNKSKLDMSEVHTLVLMGKAYVDFASKGTVPSGYSQTAESAEGLALQTNQQLYVVPTDFLTGPNPSTEDNLEVSLPQGFEINKTRDELDFDYNNPGGTPTGWFGYKYVKQTDTTDSNASQKANDIFDVYAVEIDGERVYYAYLKFNDKLWIDKNADPDIVEYEIATDRDGNPIPPNKLGSYGSVSSKAAFFDEIMKSSGDSITELQPSAHRLREKVKQSITYSQHFDLKSVLLNNSGSEVIYGRNAIVGYDTTVGTPFTPSVRGNTDGLERFAGYPENLYKRYQLLCVYLNGQDDKKLSDPISFSTSQTDKIKTDWTTSDVESPMDSFVFIGSGSASMPDTDDKMYIANHSTNTGSKMYLNADAGNEAFGKCIVGSSTYTLSSEDKLKGVALIKGDIVIESGAEVDGLLMATGTITIEGGSSSKPTKIKANKGLIQSRVEKEIGLVEEGNDYQENYLISYLTNDGSNRMYPVTPGIKREVNRIKPDYNSFMHYENWQKGN